MKAITENKGKMNFKDIREKGIKAGIAFMIIILLNGLSGSSFGQRADVHVSIRLPVWAPAYENIERIHYYYLPDIECFYDVFNGEFVYLEDGNWMFGASLPPVYSWYDLNRAFVVVLDQNVFEPWMHFHFYLAHYPRFYYRTVYRSVWADASHPLRGFNENAKIVVYNRPGVIIKENARVDHPDRVVQPTRPNRTLEYRGSEIGKPVKVQSNMKRPKETREARGPREPKKN